MRVRDIITDPVYVKADTDVYEFFRAQGAEVVNDVSQFIGTRLRKGMVAVPEKVFECAPDCEAS